MKHQLMSIYLVMNLFNNERISTGNGLISKGITANQRRKERKQTNAKKEE